MILPIVKYGHPILRDDTVPVSANSAELQSLIDDMIETMHGAAGIGLAAPQVGRSERLFVVDLSPLLGEDEEDLQDLPPFARGPMVFINPEVVSATDDDLVEFEEGCLSIPDIRERVERPDRVRVRFQDRELSVHEIEAAGFLARVIQHELDHLNGVLFIDYLSPLRRRLLQRRLRSISKGEVETDYPLA